MSLTGWILICTISCALAMNSGPYKPSLRSASNILARKQNDMEMNLPNYGSNLRSFKHHGEPNDRSVDDFDQLNDVELLSEIARENGQEETIGDGFQNMRDNPENAYKVIDYLLHHATPNDAGQSSNFRERERSQIHSHLNNEDYLAREMLDNLEAREEANQNDKYSIPREYFKYPQYAYEFPEADPYRSKLFDDRGMKDENIEDYDTSDQEYYLAPVPIHAAPERRNVNGRYPLGRDFRSYRDFDKIKRFPVAKRSPKPINKKRQVTDPKVAEDLASLFGYQTTENLNNVHHQTTSDVQNHTLNHQQDHTTAASASTSTPKGAKEKEVMQSLKTKERPIDVQKKDVDWSQYFGIDRRKKKTVLAARPGIENQDDISFLEHFYSAIQSPKMISDGDLEEKVYKLQQIDNRLKNIKDLLLQEANLEGSLDTDNPEETKESILRKLKTAHNINKIHLALRNYMQHQEKQLLDSYEGGSDFDKSDDKFSRREEGIRH